ncbi:MAG: ROK family protein [Clostridia bacterium]|nr:ROK family protein [Clostridia bacterium]MDE6356197.1 ROK family protein [Clostridia bacterium]MDE7214761.1 ROK family protein [Clostridia bacterium]
MALYLGIDVGGTTVKGIILNDNGKLLTKGHVTTAIGEGLAGCIEMLCEQLVQNAGGLFSQVKCVGVGCPGIIDSENGTVVFAGNLKLKNYPLKKLLEEKLGVTVKVCNDANAAALGEAKYGAGKGFSDSVLVTLGTGVGAGVVIGGKLFEGFKSAGTEIGHMVIERGGDRCTCGRRGCFEVYCSARALTNRTKWAMEEDTSSDMWKTYGLDTADGRTPFEYMDGDRTARLVVDWYLKYLATGLANIANIFRPQVIMIGGGVSAQGSRLTVPLQKLMDAELFGGTDYAPVQIACATLGSDAGAYGAAALGFEV